MKTMNVWKGAQLIGVGVVVIAAIAGCGKKEETPPVPAPAVPGIPATTPPGTPPTPKPAP